MRSLSLSTLYFRNPWGNRWLQRYFNRRFCGMMVAVALAAIDLNSRGPVQ
jgi:hypothetical protein